MLGGWGGNRRPDGKYWQPTARYTASVTFGLTAEDRDQLRNPTLVSTSEYGTTFYCTDIVAHICQWDRFLARMWFLMPYRKKKSHYFFCSAVEQIYLQQPIWFALFLSPQDAVHWSSQSANLHYVESGKCWDERLAGNQPPSSTQPGHPFLGRRNEYTGWKGNRRRHRGIFNYCVIAGVW